MFLPYSFTSNSEQKNSFRTHRKAIIEAVYLGGQNWDETGRNDLQRMMASKATQNAKCLWKLSCSSQRGTSMQREQFSVSNIIDRSATSPTYSKNASLHGW